MKIAAAGQVPNFMTSLCLALTTSSTLLMADWSFAAGKNEKKLPPLATVQKVVANHLKSLPDYRNGDLISSSDVQPVFRQLAKLGWDVVDQQEILKEMLSDSHFLVKDLRTPNGKRFMRKVSSDPTVYDRLDRVSQHKRGKATIRELVRLPDGEKYTKAKSGPGNPTISDLVLIYDRGSAKKRAIKDYDKPTGTIYTGDAFLQRLKKSYAEARLPKKTTPH